MRKLLCCLVAACVLLLCGCSNTDAGANSTPGVKILSNEQYSIMESNGEHYFDFKGDVDLSAESGQTSAAIPGSGGIAFKSVKAMRDRLVNGGFSRQQISDMKYFARTSAGDIAVCNVNALWDVVLPKELSLEWVKWYGLTYNFRLLGDDLEGTLYITSENDYKLMQKRRTLEETNNRKITSVETEPERNATVITFESSVASSGKQIEYGYEDNGFTITVYEIYYEDYYDDHRSEKVPFIITVMGEGNGIYYYWSIGGFTERPSYEWIKSIGVTPYVETE